MWLSEFVKNTLVPDFTMISNSENHPFWFFGGKKIRIEAISVPLIFKTLNSRQFS
jgi:hypothetical protein